jgi:hypothetical protein
VCGRTFSLSFSDKVQQVKVVNLRAIYQRRRRSTKEKRNWNEIFNSSQTRPLLFRKVKKS